MKVRKAVIPAAGFERDFCPRARALPKEMFPIVDTPTLQYIVEEAVSSGIREILIILGRNKKRLKTISTNPLSSVYARENNKLEYLKIVPGPF